MIVQDEYKIRGTTLITAMQSLNRGKNLLLSDVQLTAHLLGKMLFRLRLLKCYSR